MAIYCVFCRNNAINWQFSVFFVVIYASFGVNFILQKFFSCKKMTNMRYDQKRQKIWYHSNNYNNMWHVTKQLCVLMAVIVDREKQPHHIHHNLMNVEKQFILLNGLSRGNRPCFFGLPTFNEKWFILNGFVSGVSTLLLHKAKHILF